jgi:Xaa-Pro aminopeptidase
MKECKPNLEIFGLAPAVQWNTASIQCAMNSRQSYTLEMRTVHLAAALLSCSIGLMSAPAIPPAEYQTRRETLRKALDGTLVLFGSNEGADEVYAFHQESNFQYLTGWTEPGAILLVTPTEEMLFLPPHDQKREKFTGNRSSAEDADAASVSGFKTVYGTQKFEEALDRALDEHQKLYTLPAHPGTEKLKARYPFRSLADATPLISKLRMKKSAAEVAAIQHATDVTVEGHRAAWKRISAGLYEYQLAATVTNVYLESGCDRHAYAPIVGSGSNGTVLHYSANGRRMDRGELVVMDTAAEYAHHSRIGQV